MRQFLMCFALIAAVSSPAAAQTRAGRVIVEIDIGYDIGAIVPHYSGPRAVASSWLAQRRFADAAPLLADMVGTGDGWAAGQLARLYMHGLGVERDDSMAISLLEFAAETGDPHAALAAGFARAQGLGAPADLPSARHWLLRAARIGDEYVRRDARQLLRALPQN